VSPATGQAGIGGELVPGLPCRFQTRRLDLRPLEDGDRPLYVALYTDAGVMRHVGAPLSPDAAGRSFERVQQQMRQRPPQAWYWIACLRGCGREAGLLALMFDPGRESAEFGMMMPAWAQGSGYATEAVGALVVHGLGGEGTPGAGACLQRLHTRHVAGHPAGPRVMAKLGFIAGPSGQRMSHWYLDRIG
jgi:RimJ/RimL family protein N-acetyltransferase